MSTPTAIEAVARGIAGAGHQVCLSHLAGGGIWKSGRMAGGTLSVPAARAHRVCRHELAWTLAECMGQVQA